MRRRFHDQHGTSAVEFAIIISLVFIVLFGIIQFGIAYNRYQSINAAAREGARLASLRDTNVNAIQDRALQSLSILNPANFKNGGARVYSCDAATLAVEKGCVEVYQESTTVAGDFGSAMTNGTLSPCDFEHQNVNVKVVVKYKMRITIPLWASPAVTATGSGVFRCE
jgi:Flp pilus assembly protein TadG